MPWVHEELRHDHLLDDFWNVVLRRYKDKNDNYWWSDYSEDLEKIDAFKISFEPGLLVVSCEGDYIPNHSFPNAEEGGYLAITRHMIVKRWDGELLGLAQSTGAIRINPKKYSTDPQTFLDEMKVLFYDTVDYTTIYTYMLDRYSNHTHFEDEEGNIKPITFISQAQFNGVLASSLDIEFHSEDYYGKEMYQSPIMSLDLVYGNAYSVGAIGKLNYKTDTNWWNDSKILIQGNIDTNSFCFILRADNAPIWHDGKVPQTPFFFGDIVDKVTKEFMPVAMFGGKAVHPNFNFDNTHTITNEAIMPTTRNYVHYPSNGVDSVMLKRTRFGSRYQAHYLSWEVPSNEIPPARQRIEPNENAYNFAKNNKFFEDALAESIGEETTTFKFKPYGIGEPTSILDARKATHILIDGVEIAELVSFDDKKWIMEIKRTAEEPLSHKDGAVLWGIDKEMADMFSTKRVRAWNNLTNDPNYYKFNPHPSRYSEKIQTSRLYLVHPEEGTVGELPNMVVATSINLYDGTKLTFTRPCEDGECEEYTPPEKPESKGFLEWKPEPNSKYTESYTEGEVDPGLEDNTGGDAGGETGGDGEDEHDHEDIEDGYADEPTIEDDSSIYKLSSNKKVVNLSLTNNLEKGLNMWFYKKDPDAKTTSNHQITRTVQVNRNSSTSNLIASKQLTVGESGDFHINNEDLLDPIYLVVEDSEGGKVKVGKEGGLSLLLNLAEEPKEGSTLLNGSSDLPAWVPPVTDNGGDEVKEVIDVGAGEFRDGSSYNIGYFLEEECEGNHFMFILSGDNEGKDKHKVSLYNGKPGGAPVKTRTFKQSELSYEFYVPKSEFPDGISCVVTPGEGAPEELEDYIEVMLDCTNDSDIEKYDIKPF